MTVVGPGVGACVGAGFGLGVGLGVDPGVGLGVGHGVDAGAGTQITEIVEVATHWEPVPSYHGDASSGGPDPEPYNQTDKLPHPFGLMSQDWYWAL